MRKKSVPAIFGEKLRYLRKQRGLTQEAFADSCGFDRTYISGIECGKRNPSLIAIQRLADALGISPADFFSK